MAELVPPETKGIDNLNSRQKEAKKAAGGTKYTCTFFSYCLRSDQEKYLITMVNILKNVVN
jgi:hypothetical protein